MEEPTLIVDPQTYFQKVLHELLQEIRACTLCAGELPHPPRPVVQAGAGARVAILGQAPGRRVHESGIPWDDPSGDLLRAWLGVGRAAFYDPEQFAHVPTAFCYPGTGKTGDLPPPARCAPTWQPRLWPQLPNIRLRVVIGQYGQAFVLGERRKATLTETVKAYREYLPSHFPLPHPSPRNRRWFKQNPWFGAEVLPELHRQVQGALA